MLSPRRLGLQHNARYTELLVSVVRATPGKRMEDTSLRSYREEKTRT
jgi:hypothetical protein